MEIAELKSKMMSKQFDSIYIFTGEEIEVMNIYINQLSVCSNKPLFRADSFREVFNGVRSSRMLSQSKLYMVRDDKEVLSNEKIHGLISNTDWLKNNMLVLAFLSVDKRSKFYKAYNSRICEFKPLESAMLKRYIQKEINLSDKNCEKLINACDKDYGRILLEIDKILIFGACKAYIGDEAFEELFRNGIIYKSPLSDEPKTVIIEFVDAVLSRNADSFEKYKKCIDIEQSPLAVLSWLYNSVKHTLQVQSCQSKDVSRVTGLTGWQIQSVKHYIGKYRIGELVNMMQKIREMEMGIKRGIIEDNIAVPLLLVNVL